MRSEKPKQKKKEAKKVDLSEEQLDIQRYLGLQLSEAEERKQRGQWRPSPPSDLVWTPEVSQNLIDQETNY